VRLVPTPAMLLRLREASITVVPFICKTVDAPATFTVLLEVDKYVEAIVPILTRFPDESIRWVPVPAPVLIPVVPFRVVPVIVLLVLIVPKPEAIEPLANAPTLVNEELVTPLPKVVDDSTEVPLIW